MRVEQHLRATLRDLAGQARGVDELARTAMSQGKRMRLRRRLAMAGGAAAVLLLALAPFALGPAPSQQAAVAPPAGASGTQGPGLPETGSPKLTGGWVVAGIHNLVLNRADNTFHRLQTEHPQPEYLAAPAGDLAAIVTSDFEGNQDRVEIVTTAGTPVQRVLIKTNGVFQWSPQGDRIVTGVWGPKDTPQDGFSFAVIEARTGRITTHRVDLKRFDCSQCQFVWSRDGNEIAMGIAARIGGESQEAFNGVQFFDARTGEPTRSVPVRAMFTGPFSWSPNGRYVVARPDGLKRDDFQLIDTTTLKASPFPVNAVFVSDDLLLGAEGNTIVAFRRDGTTVQRFELTEELKDLGGNVTFGPPS